jgi:hypothetical protein
VTVVRSVSCAGSLALRDRGKVRLTGFLGRCQRSYEAFLLLFPLFDRENSSAKVSELRQFLLDFLEPKQEEFITPSHLLPSTENRLLRFFLPATVDGNPSRLRIVKSGRARNPV